MKLTKKKRKLIEEKTMEGDRDYKSIRKRNIINPDKPTLVIDAETFEIVRGEK